MESYECFSNYHKANYLLAYEPYRIFPNLQYIEMFMTGLFHIGNYAQEFYGFEIPSIFEKATDTLVSSPVSSVDFEKVL